MRSFGFSFRNKMFNFESIELTSIRSRFIRKERIKLDFLIQILTRTSQNSTTILKTI